ncbi:hypothetical protein MRB53_034927 [Persea americana]|uniref:Uncharacterized protein n=2 Tax=Persea americana TaxID=3435 RepID=A0ACC2K393_PERAE|nr:hypothetical protein MRB53_034927 [Persea americana]
MGKGGIINFPSLNVTSKLLPPTVFVINLIPVSWSTVTLGIMKNMASGSHDDEFDPEIRNEINVEEDEIDESYAPDKDDDFVEYNYDGMELEDENWEFENDFISGSEGVGHE